jgi:hypothetical protein
MLKIWKKPWNALASLFSTVPNFILLLEVNDKKILLLGTLLSNHHIGPILSCIHLKKDSLFVLYKP